MNTKLIVGASILMLILGSMPAMAYRGTREATLPGGADTPAGGASLAFCERLSDAVAPSPLYCEGFGFAAQFADIGCRSDFQPGGPVFFGNGDADNDPTAGNGDTTTGAAATQCLDDYDGANPSATPDDANAAGADA